MIKHFKPGDLVVRLKDSAGKGRAQRGQVAHVVSVSRRSVIVCYPGKFREFWLADNAELYAAPANTAPDLKWTELRGEISRTYHFSEDQRIKVVGVVRLCVRPSGHRLETESGKKFIIPGKFTAIEIVAKEWSA
ncbi:hypothetical protein [Lysobacter capsici]|uniref:hypothetical protein n=1 Tax=Lysobacter capsici TaxID=435897 RepID=UPI001C0062A0|nr:hypothetical protein [Lysobacter capsici]QWF18716.1 hypothetical protein KME82_08225 [Lysobacter capsici]